MSGLPRNEPRKDERHLEKSESMKSCNATISAMLLPRVLGSLASEDGHHLSAIFREFEDPLSPALEYSML